MGGKRKPKPASEMTDKELEQRLFPKPVLEELLRIAHEGDDDSKPDKSSHK